MKPYIEIIVAILNNRGVFLLASEIVDQFSYLFKEILDKGI
jgi:hypothetical protein